MNERTYDTIIVGSGRCFGGKGFRLKGDGVNVR